MDQSTRPTYVESSTSTSLASAKSFIDRCRSLTQNIPSHERLVEPVLTPRFVPTCTDELLNGLAHMSREEHVRVQSHLAEARDQVDWVKSTRNADDIDVFDKVRFRPAIGFLSASNHRATRLPC
jgi:guanine deaminase